MRPDAQRAGHLLAPDVQVAVLDPDVLADVGAALDGERQRVGLAEHLDRLGDDLDRAGGQLRVLVPRRAQPHLAGHPDAELGAQVVRDCLVAAPDDLHDAARVAQVDEDHAAVVAPPRHPAGQDNPLPRVLRRAASRPRGSGSFWSPQPLYQPRRSLARRHVVLVAVLEIFYPNEAVAPLLRADEHRERGARTGRPPSWRPSGRGHRTPCRRAPPPGAAPSRASARPRARPRRGARRRPGSRPGRGESRPLVRTRLLELYGPGRPRTRCRAAAGRRCPRKARRTGRRRRCPTGRRAARGRTRTWSGCSSPGRGPGAARR